MHGKALIVSLVLLAAAAPARGEGLTPAETDMEELTCLALNIYHEGRGEPLEGQRAVAHVTLNRVAHPDYPDSICAVVRQGGDTPPCQFSWYCDGRSDRPYEAGAWAEALKLARDVMNRSDPDPTGGALFYHVKTLSPSWSRNKAGPLVIGQHVFFRLSLH